MKHRIDFEFNLRFTRKLGDATYNHNKKRGLVRLSTPLWQRATEEQRRETVIHEACHVIVFSRRSTEKHGPKWCEAMLNCGISPERTHHVDRTGLYHRQKRYIVSSCPNAGVDHKCRVSARRLGQLKKGCVLHCRICKIDIRYDDVEEDDYKK